MARFGGKVALVLGGASGIGKATCLLLAREGATVIAGDLNEDGARDVAAACGPTSLYQRIDVSDEAEWVRLSQRLETAFGGVDILVNSAGFSYLENLSDATVDHWRREIDVNLTGTFLASRFGVALMRQRGGPAAIVHVSSVYGIIGVAHAAAYCASKAGMTMLTKAVALHCASEKWPIRCNSVHPTYVDTPLLRLKEQMYGGETAMLAAMAAEVPLGRVATPEDIANAIAFLASDAADLITGTSLVIDGGVTAGVMDRH